MTFLTERQAARLRDRLAELPVMAQAASEDGPGGSTVGSAAPPGVDLTRVDRGREQPHLLARLAEAVRVVAREEMPPDVFDRAPDRADVPTWESEAGWLIATMGWWQGDDWCAEWISGEVRAIRRALINLIEANAHYRTCGICGSSIEAYRLGDYAMAECPKCQRILGMQEVGYEERIKAARNLLHAIGGMA